MNYKDDIVKSLVTMKEMLEARGASPDELNLAFDHIANDQISILLQSSTPFYIDLKIKNLKTRIVYDIFESKKTKQEKVGDLKKMIDSSISTYIFVLKDKPNANDLKNYNELNIDYQIFSLNELQFNISKHILVPKHEVISDEAIIEQLMKNYMVKSRSQFPIILKTDPMAKFLHAKPGNIVKITRPSPTSSEIVVFRCCV